MNDVRADFQPRTGVTPIRWNPDQPRPFGRVNGHAEDPITGETLVMVRWPGAPVDTPHHPDELAILD
ncbi:hypothetical protein CP973_39380 [Streptomyces albofaciens JCM 4342]|uniref:hypothetical protein n=1 Tax=Streptomyces albofaciens TaxID=66866 RepID=UPI000B045E4A|nr:hypothetical protein [Streptomyces albofaciens]KAA6215062.1 hypothetical protein CP973_39380 [Streptomyces albofaciens JCM 4342]